MRQFNETLQRASDKDRAERNLSKLAVKLFVESMDSEQADFFADMIRGVSPIIVSKVRRSAAVSQVITHRHV